jgi:uncharacterized membrane protein YGL010W
MIGPQLATHFEEYAKYHRHPVNVLTHKIAMPLIVFHIVAMLDWVALSRTQSGLSITLAHIAYVAVGVWYLSMNVRIGLILLVVFAMCFPIGHLTPRWGVVVIALVGWGIQLAGHAIWEKKSPAFVQNLIQALVGPAYFVARALKWWPRPT